MTPARAALFAWLLTTSLSSSAGEAFYLSPARGSDCIHEQVLNRVLTRKDILAPRSSDADFSFIEAGDCGNEAINVGINGENYTLDKNYPEELGVPVDYYSDSNSVRVRIEQVRLIYRDDKNKVEVDPGEFCVPEYRKVRVVITFEGVTRTVFGTALGNCP